MQINDLENKIKILEAEKEALIKELNRKDEIINSISNYEKEQTFHFKIIENITDAVYIIEAASGNIIYCNPAFEKLFGYNSGELLYKNVSIVNAQTDKNPEETAVEIFAALHKFGIWEGEIANIKKDRTVFYCFATATKFEHPKHGTVWVSTHKDITEKRQIEQKLIQGEERYKSFFESASLGIGIAKENKIIAVNNALISLFGYSEEELINKTTIDFFHPEDRSLLIDRSRKRAQGEFHDPNLIIRIICKNGEIRIVDINTSVFYINNEQYIQTIFIDITERKKAEQNLAKSKEHLQLITNNLPALISHLDSNLNYLYANGKYSELFGIDSSDIIGKNVKDIIGDRAYEASKPYYLRVLSGETVSFDNFILDKNNENRYLHVTYVPQFENKNVTGLFLLAWDITDQKKAEQSLRESEVKFKQIVEIAGEGICYIDVNNAFKFVNKAAEQIFEVEKDGLIGKTVFDFIAPSYVSEIKRQTKKRNQGTKSTYDIDIITSQNNKRSILFTATPHFSDKNEYIGTYGVFRDITTRKHAEQKIQNQNEQLKSLNATKDKFFSIISHDLKSPFNLLLGISDLLFKNYDDYDDSKRKKQIKIIHDNSNRAYSLLENLLTWSSSQTGRIKINKEKLNLKFLCDDIYNLTVENADNKKIYLINNIKSDVFVNADRNMIETVIRNLVTNSIKYTNENGTVLIDVIQKHDSVEICISDTGIGMSQETIKSLFNIGETASKPGTNGEHGTGLGLILCKEFIEQHGGNMVVESELGKGSDFAFTLPLWID